MSSQRGIIGIFGILLAIIATALFIISLKNQDFIFPSMFLWFTGIILVIWWFKRERSLNLKFAMGIIFTGQIVMFLFGKSYIDEDNNFILIPISLYFLIRIHYYHIL